jgi:hypothetical protein
MGELVDIEQTTLKSVCSSKYPAKPHATGDSHAQDVFTKQCVYKVQ